MLFRSVQPALRVERVEQREEVVLVGTATVEQNEGALWIARGGALERNQAVRQPGCARAGSAAA